MRHPVLNLHMILSTNPVGEDNWTFLHFFKDDRNGRLVLDDADLYKERTVIVKETFYHHSTADDNLFLPASYIEQLEATKEYDPDLHRIAREGRFGINGKRVLPQFEEWSHDKVMASIRTIRNPIERIGMDFGFEDSYNAVVRMVGDHKHKNLYIYWQYYKNKMTDDRTAVELDEFKQSRELIIADSTEPKTIQYFKQLGFRMKGAKKFGGSCLANTKKVKRFKKIICSSN